MQIFINIIISVVLLFWLHILMWLPMLLGAPRALNNKCHIVTVMLILSYPIGVFVILKLLGGEYFGLNSNTLILVSIVVVVLTHWLFGYAGLLLNLQKGIANSGYSAVGQNVYYNAKQIQGADSESFTFFDDETYDYDISSSAMDKHHFYYNGEVVQGVVVENLQKKIIDNRIYWCNDSQVIYGGKILEGANPDGFGDFEGFYGWTYSVSKEQYIVYYENQPLSAVDKSSFTLLNSLVAKDRYQIFKEHKSILPNADVASFETLGDNRFAWDKQHIYYIAADQPFALDGVDITSFEILEYDYLKDKNHIYSIYNDHFKVLEQVDVASFELAYERASQADARDNQHLYYRGKVVGTQ